MVEVLSVDFDSTLGDLWSLPSGWISDIGVDVLESPLLSLIDMVLLIWLGSLVILDPFDNGEFSIRLVLSLISLRSIWSPLALLINRAVKFLPSLVLTFLGVKFVSPIESGRFFQTILMLSFSNSFAVW